MSIRTVNGVSRQAPRIAVVVSQLGYGGAERQTLALLKELRGTAWAPSRVICLSEDISPLGPAVSALGYPLAVISRDSGFDLKRWRRLRRELVEHDISIVHAVNWLAAAYALLAAPPASLVVTSIRNSRLPAGTWRRLILRRLVRRSAAVLVNSAVARRLLLDECRGLGDRLAFVPNGIDLERVQQGGKEGGFRHELGIAADVPLVAYVGRNARVKNIPRLIDVVGRLLARRPDVHVVIAGEGLDSRIVTGTSLEVDPRLHCVGARQDVPSLLRDSSLLLLTSDSEGTPNVVLEALAASVPVVATRVGDLPELLPEDCGILTSLDAESLASGVLQVLSCPHLYRRALAEQAKRITAAYSMSAMAAGTAAVWQHASEQM